MLLTTSPKKFTLIVGMKIVQVASSGMLAIIVILGLFLRTQFYYPNKIKTIGDDNINLQETTGSNPNYLIPLPAGNFEIPRERSKLDYLFYNRQVVSLLGGKLVDIEPGNLLLIKTDAGNKLVSLGQAKIVCQPTGRLNTEGRQSTEGIFIENQENNDNYGIPWGIEIKPGELRNRIKNGSAVLVYFSTYSSSLIDLIPETKYVWFGDCY